MFSCLDIKLLRFHLSETESTELNYSKLVWKVPSQVIESIRLSEPVSITASSEAETVKFPSEGEL